jgi:hypothetical protein
MIKHEALLKLASLKTELEAAIAAEYAKVCQLTGREYATKANLSLASGKRALARFRNAQPSLERFVFSRPGHPLYGYKMAYQSVKAQTVREILKDFAYPFSYQQLLKVDFLSSDSPVVTPSFLQSCTDTVENCEYEGMGVIRDGVGKLETGVELLVVKTGDISSWIMRDGSTLIVKSDTLPPQKFVFSNGKYSIDPADERVSFNPNALEYHLACRHCRALGYDFVHEGSSVVYLGKVKRDRPIN